MKALQERSRNAARRRLESDLDARLVEVFARCPALCGFTVTQREITSAGGKIVYQLHLSGIEAYPRLDTARGDELELYDDVFGALSDLLDEHPEAAELLGGRTFAKVWH